MRRDVAAALSALIVVAIPTILVGNALWVLLTSWFIDAQYALPGFPDDPQGLDDHERAALAKAGVRAIRPGGDGVATLREARLPDGIRAFELRELRHLEDVRGVVAGFLTAWAIALVAGVGAMLALLRLGGLASLRWSLTWGLRVTVGAMAAAGVVMAIDYDAFFDAFHGLLFEGDSWRFNRRFLLRRLYPDAFWAVASGVLVGLVLLQAGAVALALRRVVRHAPRNG